MNTELYVSPETLKLELEVCKLHEELEALRAAGVKERGREIVEAGTPPTDLDPSCEAAVGNAVASLRALADLARAGASYKQSSDALWAEVSILRQFIPQNAQWLQVSPQMPQGAAPPVQPGAPGPHIQHGMHISTLYHAYAPPGPGCNPGIIPGPCPPGAPRARP
jgi:hypothetical protein